MLLAHVPMEFQIDPSNVGRDYFFTKSLRDRLDNFGDASHGPYTYTYTMTSFPVQTRASADSHIEKQRSYKH